MRLVEGLITPVRKAPRPTCGCCARGARSNRARCTASPTIIGQRSRDAQSGTAGGDADILSARLLASQSVSSDQRAELAETDCRRGPAAVALGRTLRNAEARADAPDEFGRR